MPMVTDQQFLLFGALERQCSLSCEVILTIVCLLYTSSLFKYHDVAFTKSFEVQPLVAHFKKVLLQTRSVKCRNVAFLFYGILFPERFSFHQALLLSARVIAARFILGCWPFWEWFLWGRGLASSAISLKLDFV